MKENVNKRADSSKAHDFLKDVQYQNALFAVRQIETDRGGLTLQEIWEETEKLREQLIEVESELRDCYLIDWLPDPVKAYGTISKHPVRTQMCVLILFALRLIKAEHDQEKNPHAPIIEAIVRLVGERAKKDGALMEDLSKYEMPEQVQDKMELLESHIMNLMVENAIGVVDEIMTIWESMVNK